MEQLSSESTDCFLTDEKLSPYTRSTLRTLLTSLPKSIPANQVYLLLAPSNQHPWRILAPFATEKLPISIPWATRKHWSKQAEFVLRRGRPTWLPNWAGENAALGVPLRLQNQDLGILVVEFEGEEQYLTTKEYTLLASWATAITHLLNSQQNQEHTQQILNTFRHWIDQLSHNREEPVHMGQEFLETACKISQASGGTLLLFDEEGHITFQESYGEPIPIDTLNSVGEKLRASKETPPSQYTLPQPKLTILPLLSASSCLGALILAHNTTSPPATQPLLQAMTTQFALTLSSEHLHRQTTRRLTELAALYQASNSITILEDLPNLARTIVSTAAEISSASIAMLHLLDSKTHTLRLLALENSQSPSSSSTWDNEIPLDTDHPIAQAVWQAQTIPEDNPVAQTEPPSSPTRWIYLPLRQHDQTLGILSLLVPQKIDEELPLLTSFAERAASILQKALLFQEIQRHAERESRRSRFMQLLISTTDSRTALQKTLQTLLEETHSTAACILTPQADHFEPEITAAHQQGLTIPPLPIDGSLAGQVWRTCRTITVPDLDKCQHAEREIAGPTGSAIGIPLTVKNSVEGVLLLLAPSFEKEDIHLIESIAPSIAVTLENYHLTHRLRRQADISQVLLDISNTLTTTLDTNQILTYALRTTLDLFNAESGSIHLIDPKSNALYVAKAIGESEPLAHSIASWVVEHKRPLIFPSPIQNHQPDEAIHPSPTIHTYICVPLHFASRTLGTIEIINRYTDLFTLEDLHILEQIAALISTTLHNAQLYDELRQAKEEREELLHHIADLIVQLDGGRKICAISGGLQSLTGWMPGELIGQPCYSLFKCPECPHNPLDSHQQATSSCPLDKAEREGRAFFHPEYTRALHTRHGDTIPIMCVTAPLIPPSENGAVIVNAVWDASRRAELEALKRDFIAMVSHQLRSPLATMRTALELLTEPDLPPERREEWLAIVLAQNERLTRTVEEILEVSRLDSGQDVISFQPVAAGAIARTIVDALTPISSPCTLHLQIEPDLPPVWGDPAKVAHILENLIHNAICYSPNGGPIIVQVKRDPAGVRFSVKDHGIGIAPEHLPRIFDRFYRVNHPETRHVSGTGLGLYIVKTLVERMGGTVGVESHPNRGSLFYFTLPTVDMMEAIHERTDNSTNGNPANDPAHR